jgi:5-methylcytosine-specific restriction protein A
VAGGWQGSDRKSRLPSNWTELRLRVLRRDGYRCQHRDAPGAPPCGVRGSDVDHKTPGDNHSMSNLQTLCTAHHRAKSSREGVEARRSRFRDPEPHPGLIASPPKD